MNSLHPNIQFTKEEENTQSEPYFPFLDVKVMKSGNSFLTSTYYKPTYTGLYTNWMSFTPRKYKINLVKTLLFRAWQICSTKELFEYDTRTIIKNLLKNQYPRPLLEAIMKNFVNKMESEIPNVAAETYDVPKKEVLLILPYLGSMSESFERNITSLIHSAFKQVKLRIVFRTTCRMANMFKFKDIIPKRLSSRLVYGVYCTECPAFYVGKTMRHLEKRFAEHRDLRKPTAVTNHMTSNGHGFLFSDVKILTKGNHDTQLLIKESLVIRKLRPPLNETASSYPLEMF